MRPGYSSVPTKLHLFAGEYGACTFTKHFMVRLQAAMNGWDEDYFARLLDSDALQKADEAYQLYYRHGVPLTAIADMMGASERTIRRRLRVARQFYDIFWQLTQGLPDG